MKCTLFLRSGVKVKTGGGKCCMCMLYVTVTVTGCFQKHAL
jgi:hypothetical protein